MNYKITSTRSKREPLVHKFGGRLARDKYGNIHIGDYTLCGLKIENSLYGRWEPTEEEVTCKRCLGKL